MHNRQTLSFLWTGALFLGLSLAGGYARAEAPVKKEAAKGKTGAACKSSSDCDQSSQPQTCKDGKCHAEPLPPPPT